MNRRQVHIAPEVETLIGPESTRRIRNGEMMTDARCRTCGRDLDADAEAVNVVCLEIAIDRTESVRIAQMAHAACGPSRVIIVDPDDLTSDDTTASVVTMGWPVGSTGVRMIALIHLHSTLTGYDNPAMRGEGRDLVLSNFLSQGWQLVTHWAQPLNSPDGEWRLTYRPAAIPGPGHFRLTDPAGGTVVEVPDLTIMEPWLRDVASTGAVDVYLVPLPIHRWEEGPDYPALVKAVKQGKVVGTRLDFDLLEV